MNTPPPPNLKGYRFVVFSHTKWVVLSPWRLFHVSGSPLIGAYCQSRDEWWCMSAHSSSYLFWWCSWFYISVLVFLWVTHLPPCPALFLLYGYRIYVSHVHTSLVASESCVLLSAEVAASLISSFMLWSLRLTPLFISISSLFFIVQHSAWETAT